LPNDLLIGGAPGTPHPVSPIDTEREGVPAHQGAEHAFTDIRSQSEKPPGLSWREAEARHFGEFRPNPAEQFVARRNVSALDDGGCVGGNVHCPVLSKNRSVL
jgi:hypothetical protein